LPPNSSRLDCKCHAMHVFKPIILTRDLAPLCSSRIYIYIYIYSMHCIQTPEFGVGIDGSCLFIILSFWQSSVILIKLSFN
jgi:hypothetical protein